MVGSNSGPVRWNPPMTACSLPTPVRRWAYRQMLITPACPAAGQDDQFVSGDAGDQRLVI